MGDETKKPIDIFIEKLKETCSEASGFICIPFKDIETEKGKGIVAATPDPIVVGAINIFYASKKLYIAKENANRINEERNVIASCSSEREINELISQ